ncbi:MAG: hypothetical protein BWX49_00767 [Bacteroidetes bacterium ADurb.Bin008]|nr:MAG: hypothetical protein BWX49_00767 [Bacteroidetes bacterium ADurb.Bin008]
MKMVTVLMLFAVVLILSSCHKRVPCPAYAHNAPIDKVEITQ